jgi:DNA-directed RNA polymerase subunit RPC12/RpoP
MAIRVKCGRCGGEFQARPELVGKHGKCPKCGEAIVVPNVPASGAAKIVAGGTSTPQSAAAAQPSAAKTCPSCGKGLQVGAVICVSCGLDLRSGKRLGAQQSSTPPASNEDRSSAPAEACPRCNMPMPPGITACSACGYRAQEREHLGRSPWAGLRWVRWAAWGIGIVLLVVMLGAIVITIVMPPGMNPNERQGYHTLLGAVCGCSCPFLLILLLSRIRSWSRG